MFGALNHVAIAVPDLAAAISLYTKLGARISPPEDLPEHGVTVAFVELPNTKIEIMAQLGDRSPIAAFLAKNPGGGIHHICLEVSDIDHTRSRLVGTGLRVLGCGEPTLGAHGNPVLFVHPKDFTGTLVEFEQTGTALPVA